VREGVAGGGAAVVASTAPCGGTTIGVREAGGGVNVCVAVNVGVGVLVTVGVSDAGGAGVKVEGSVLISPDG
jgi:hypothetical protein